jgi:glycosyltransferase involved in cell wall biosynthesis
MWLPVVTTSYGLGPIQARGGVGLEVADDPGTFVDKVAELLQDAEKRRNMGAAARQFVMDRHSWEAAARKIDQIYASLVKQWGGVLTCARIFHKSTVAGNAGKTPVG